MRAYATTEARRIYFKSNKGDTYLRELELYDVNENNRYGGYIGRAPKGSSDSSAGQKDVICEMRGKACSSEQEWWELSNPRTLVHRLQSDMLRHGVDLLALGLRFATSSLAA